MNDKLHRVSIVGSGFHMRTEMTDEEYYLFHKIMAEEKLPNHKAYLKMLNILHPKT